VDIHTLHVEHVVLLTVYTLLVLANSWVHRNTNGIRWFFLYNLFALLGAVSVALRGRIPDFLSIVVGNLLVMAGYFLLFCAVMELFRRKSRQIYLQAFLMLVGTVAMVETGYIYPDTKDRLIAFSAILLCQQVQIAIFLFRKDSGDPSIAGNSMGLIMVGLALSNLIRLVGVAYQGAPQDYLRSGEFLAWIVIVNSCLQCGAMVAYVWMTAALLRRDLEVQASTDPLTGLLNRRAFESASERAFGDCREAHLAFAAIIVDLDGFKEINDTFGHHYGDETLVSVARALAAGMRKKDVLARIGGDEFAVVLPRTTLEEAEEIAERLRHAIEKTAKAREGVGAKLTASFGVAVKQGSTDSWDQLMVRCDQALYAVKRVGGNLVQHDLRLSPGLPSV
jgi:diguanylate cyclase (GGDEF)-like protein